VSGLKKDNNEMNIKINESTSEYPYEVLNFEGVEILVRSLNTISDSARSNFNKKYHELINS
jgi:hypothetical protein